MCFVVVSNSFVTPWTVTCQAPLSMGFSRQEYQSGLSFPSPWDLPDPGIEPRSPTLQAGSLPTEPSGKPKNFFLPGMKGRTIFQCVLFLHKIAVVFRYMSFRLFRKHIADIVKILNMFFHCINFQYPDLIIYSQNSLFFFFPIRMF